MSSEEYDIPNSWIWTRIGEISNKIHYGYTASADEKPIGPHMLRITDIQDGKVNWKTVPYCSIDDDKISKYLLDEGDIVFARTGATVGKSYMIPSHIPESVFASYLIRVILNDLISKKYVYYYFQSQLYWIQISQSKVGIGQPNVNATKLSNLSIPLAPLNVQRRIVSKIDELFGRLDAGVRSLSASKVNAEQYRSSLLRSAFRGDLTAKWRKSNQYPPVQHSESAPERLPDSWEWKRAGDAFDIILGQSPPSSTYNKDGIGLPFFQGSKEFGLLYPKIDRWCSEPIRIAEKGDVLLSVRAPVGDTNICPERACIGRGLAAVRPKDSTQTSFTLNLFRALKNNFIRQSTGTTFNAITGNRLRSTKVPIPPQAEQQVIVDTLDRHLSVASNSLRNLEQSHQYAENLKHSILRSAFRGQLVKQNAKDEPAEALLSRIKKEKQSVQKRLV